MTLQLSKQTAPFRWFILLFGALSCVFFIGAPAFAGGTVSKFSLHPGYNKVTLKWEIQGEKDVKTYEIQRGLTSSTFLKVGQVPAQQKSSLLKKYEYVDKSVFKSANNGRSYYYRLKIINVNGSHSFSKVEHVSPTISSARQTWGSIKALFR